MYIHLIRNLSKIIIFVFTINVSSYAQEPYHWQLSDEEGLPSMTIYKVIQDKKGLIWIATANGLCSFDGKNVINYYSSILNDQEILKIQEGTDGNIWGMNLSGQLFYLKNNKITIIDTTIYNKIEKVIDFQIIEHFIYISNKRINNKNNNKNNLTSQNELIQLNTSTKQVKSIKCIDYQIVNQKHNITDTKFPSFSLSKKSTQNKKSSYSYDPPIVNLSQYNNKLIYSIIENNELTICSNDNNSLSSKIFSIYLSNTGGKFYSFIWRNYYILIANQQLHYKNLKDNSPLIKLNYNLINNYFLVENNLILNQNKGFYVLNEINSKSELFFSNLSIYDAFIDEEKNLWLSTDGDGIIIIPNFESKFYSTSNSELKSNTIYSLKKTSDSKILIGKKDKTITQFDGKKILNHSIPYSGRILSIIEDNNKNILIGGDIGILYSKNIYKSNILKVKAAIKVIFKSRNKDIYFGNNLYFGKIINENTHELISYLKTYAIGETSDGTIWVGTIKGVYTYDGKSVEKSEIPDLQNIRVTSMATDKEGKLWICSQGNGVFVIKDNKLAQNFNSSNSFITNTFNCVYSESNFVWLGSDKGIYRYDLSSKTFNHISKYYGLPTNDILSLCVMNNDLFIGTSKGLVQMPIKSIKPNLTIPKISIKQILINEIARDTNNREFSLGYNENTISVSYISYQYRTRGNVQYEYRIKELDSNWTKTEERNLRFANMQAGKYSLEIRTKNDNNISSESINLTFDIQKPFWQQLWFYFALFIATGFGVSYYLNRRYSTQMTIEGFKMKALQSQMNPHFIFNSLNAIQHFLTSNDSDKAIKYLSKFAKLIRIVFEYNKKQDITFAEEFEMLTLYLSLEKLRFKDKVEIHIEISDKVEKNKDNIFIPPLLIQPIIENAFKHGLFHKKEKGNLWIKFDYIDNQFLKCEVKDDGVGRAATQKITSWKQKHTSSGINSTYERLKFRHRKNNVKIDNFFKIEDVIENGEAKGTIFTLII